MIPDESGDRDGGDVERGVREILHQLLPTFDIELPAAADLFGAGLDSLKAVEFVLEIEDRFGVDFSFADITYDSFRTLRSVAALIRSKRHRS